MEDIAEWMTLKPGLSKAYMFLSFRLQKSRRHQQQRQE